MDERVLIREAMDRLLAGKPQQSTGALNVVSLAQEAGVKRHVLTHRHQDLKDEFNRRVRDQGHVPESETNLRLALTAATAKLARTRQENQDLKRERDTVFRILNVLALENDALRSRIATLSNVTPLVPLNRNRDHRE